ncbi:MAG: hypothetical protein Q4E07_05660 [Eubacteriales bacterium]|nr:hypothetical protein [Eubacteriales bacterium]
MPDKITVKVKLNEKTFKRFTRFDTLRLRKRWVRPLVFALIMIAFGLVALLSKKEQSGLIAAVLFAVGLGLPIVYFGFFFSQINLQALNLKLGKGRRVYTIYLTKQNLEVHNDIKKEETLMLPWKKVLKAFRVKGCIYVYVSPVKAFLLPDGQADATDDEVWEYLIARMGRKRCKG